MSEKFEQTPCLYETIAIYEHVEYLWHDSNNCVGIADGISPFGYWQHDFNTHAIREAAAAICFKHVLGSQVFASRFS